MVMATCGMWFISCQTKEQKSFNALVKTLNECETGYEEAVNQVDIDLLNEKLEGAIEEAMALQLDVQEGLLQKEALLKRCGNLQAIGRLKERIIDLSQSMGAIPSHETMRELTRTCVANGDTVLLPTIVKDFWEEKGLILRNAEEPSSLLTKETKELLLLRNELSDKFTEAVWTCSTIADASNMNQFVLKKKLLVEMAVSTNKFGQISLTNDEFLSYAGNRWKKQMEEIFSNVNRLENLAKEINECYEDVMKNKNDRMSRKMLEKANEAMVLSMSNLFWEWSILNDFLLNDFLTNYKHPNE